MVLLFRSQALYQLNYVNIDAKFLKNYLFNLRISKAMLQTLDQYWSTLVRFVYFFHFHFYYLVNTFIYFFIYFFEKM